MISKITVGFIGDSLTNGFQDFDNPHTGFLPTEAFRKFCSNDNLEVEICVIAVNGITAPDFAANQLEDACTKLKNADVRTVFITLGTNDCQIGNQVEPEDFKNSLLKICRRLLENGVEKIFLNYPPTPRFEECDLYNEKSAIAFEKYLKVITEIAGEGCGEIEVNIGHKFSGEQLSDREYYSDLVHFNNAGYEILGKLWALRYIFSDYKQTVINGVCVFYKNRKPLESQIKSNGENNFLIIRDVDDSTQKSNFENFSFRFAGDNNIIYTCGLLKSDDDIPNSVQLKAKSGATLFIGRNVVINSDTIISADEGKNIFIGKGTMISFGVEITTTDSHPVYDFASNQRINKAKSIIIGDYCWIGKKATILKGSHLGSGSILGTRAVFTGKKAESSSTFAGNPAKKIGDKEIFWTRYYPQNDEPIQDEYKSKIDKMKYVYDEEQSYTVEKLDYFLHKDVLSRISLLKKEFDLPQCYPGHPNGEEWVEKQMKKLQRRFAVGGESKK